MAITDRFDFHVDRFMNSYKADLMDSSEVGQYLLLLCKAWAMNKDTCLPNDIPYLSRCARVAQLSDKVLECFPVVETDSGPMRRNNALHEEWKAVQARIEEGRRGGKARSAAKTAAAKENGKRGGRPANRPEPEQEPNEEPNGNPTEPNGNPSLQPNETQPVPYRTVAVAVAVPNRTVPSRTAAVLPAEKQASENGGQSGSLSEAEPSSPKSKSNVKSEAQRWNEFITDQKADLPEAMKYAEPTKEERRRILAQLDAIVLDDYAIKHGSTKAEFLGMAISDWAQQQSPPIGTLQYGRWKRWLETGNPNS